MQRIVDLTLTLKAGMRGVAFEPQLQMPKDGWNTTNLTLLTHCGTHMDAPRHFLAEGDTIDHMPLDRCIGPARIVNLAPVQPREVLTVERLGPAANQIDSGDRVLLRTDWYHRHGTADYRDALPRVGAELARWLAERRVAMLGVEPPSVADVNNPTELTEIHTILLEAGIVIVEGLAYLDQLQKDRIQLIVLPLKVLGGDGSPVRAVAIEETQ